MPGTIVRGSIKCGWGGLMPSRMLNERIPTAPRAHLDTATRLFPIPSPHEVGGGDRSFDGGSLKIRPNRWRLSGERDCLGRTRRRLADGTLRNRTFHPFSGNSCVSLATFWVARPTWSSPSATRRRNLPLTLARLSGEPARTSLMLGEDAPPPLSPLAIHSCLGCS
jgi:hypothetical protein